MIDNEIMGVREESEIVGIIEKNKNTRIWNFVEFIHFQCMNTEKIPPLSISQEAKNI